MRSNRRAQRGQSLVELAIFAPVMVLILLIAVDFGRVYMAWVNINNMARIGANYAAINPTGWEGSGDTNKQARYRELMLNDYQALEDCETPTPLPDPDFSGYTFGSYVEVELTCDFALITPFLSTLIGDGAGNVPVSAAAVFTVRTGSVDGQVIGGGGLPSPDPTLSPPPTAEPTPAATPDPNTTPDPNATPEPTFPAVTVDFYGTPTSFDSYGGGPAPSPGFENIVGIEPLSVTFSNTTTGDQWTCLWDFGDSTTNNSCGATVSTTYNDKGTYHVTLMVNGQSLTRTGYVTVGCKVPSLSGVRLNSATGPNGMWAQAGFDPGNITALPPQGQGNSNYFIRYQSLAGGLINPPGGCSGATITVGPQSNP